MGKIREKANCETLWMEFDYENDIHHKQPQIMIGDGGSGYISIIMTYYDKNPVFKMNYSRAWATEEEVNIIIKALQDAKKRFIKKE